MTQSLGWKEAHTVLWYVGPSARVHECCLNPALRSRRITKSAKASTQEADHQVVATGAAARELAKQRCRGRNA